MNENLSGISFSYEHIICPNKFPLIKTEGSVAGIQRYLHFMFDMGLDPDKFPLIRTEENVSEMKRYLAFHVDYGPNK